METDHQTGETRPYRRPVAVLARRAPFFVAVHIEVTSGTRMTATCELSWVNTGKPWIDLDEGVLHRIGDDDEENKRRGYCLLPVKLNILRPIAEAHLAAGCIWVVNEADGKRLKSLNNGVWHDILEDACVPYRVYHCTKDTAVQISRVEKVRLYDAEYFQTDPDTLTANYGADSDLGLQMNVAEAMGNRERWHAKYEGNEARRATAAQARAAREAPLLVAAPPVASQADEPGAECFRLPVPVAANDAGSATKALGGLVERPDEFLALRDEHRRRNPIPRQGGRGRGRAWPKRRTGPRGNPRRR